MISSNAKVILFIGALVAYFVWVPHFNINHEKSAADKTTITSAAANAMVYGNLLPSEDPMFYFRPV